MAENPSTPNEIVKQNQNSAELAGYIMEVGVGLNDPLYEDPSFQKHLKNRLDRIGREPESTKPEWSYNFWKNAMEADPDLAEKIDQKRKSYVVAQERKENSNKKNETHVSREESVKSHNKKSEAYLVAQERKEHPESGEYELIFSRQKSPPKDPNTILAPGEEKGVVAEGFIVLKNPDKLLLSVDDNGEILFSSNLVADTTGAEYTGLPIATSSSRNRAESSLELSQNAKYLRGNVEVFVDGLSGLSEEGKKNLILNIDKYIAEGVGGEPLRNIADVVALYRLRLMVLDRDKPMQRVDFVVPENIFHGLGEQFGEEYPYDDDPGSQIAVDSKGESVKKTSGVWFSFQKGPTGKEVVYDSFVSWNGNEQPRAVATQAVSLLVVEEGGVQKGAMGFEYSPAKKAYELIGIGGGFSPTKGAEGIKKRITTTISSETAQEQGLEVDGVVIITDLEKPLMNAPRHYAQETHLAIARISGKGERDTVNADEVTDAGLVTVTFDELDRMIYHGQIKDPSIIAARAIMVARKIDVANIGTQKSGVVS